MRVRLPRKVRSSRWIIGHYRLSVYTGRLTCGPRCWLAWYPVRLEHVRRLLCRSFPRGIPCWSNRPNVRCPLPRIRWLTSRTRCRLSSYKQTDRRWVPCRPWSRGPSTDRRLRRFSGCWSAGGPRRRDSWFP